MISKIERSSSLSVFRKALVWLFGICLALGAASAQGTIAIEPPVELYEAAAGSQVDGTVQVINVLDVPARVRVYLQDWFYTPDGQIQFPEAATQPRSSSGWITFNPAQFELGPDEVGTLRYSARVPDDAEPGSHWSVLFFEAEPLGQEPGVTLATMNVRVGHILYVNVPPTDSAGVIAGIIGIPPEADGRPYGFRIQYLNSGNVAQIVEGRLEVRDATGTTVVTAGLEPFVVLPGAARIARVDMVGPLPAGPYTALAILNYGNENIDVAGDYTFELDAPLPAPAAPSEPATTPDEDEEEADASERENP